ncbi:dTDP-4-dehydrorhamnose reductase [Ensifer sp. YR511]|uniref:dTDP-4-dehydrorhamnose reductase n=1 Tax=Ensifer sp. YR511 TaxID=1855294 RepID=UPI0008836C66|nr:dTDP-4-dehydrorhamnose reductase [Ensifer sp. YR511]SDN45262.1 dTDP-4-dehydrorhamnose reductase [Ensifer sp. YR511]
MKPRRILITGGTGQVGIELLQCQWPSDIELVAPSRRELDLSNCDQIERYIAEGDFSAVVNSGAYTAVDRAENEIVAAWRTNALAPAAIAAATKACCIPIVHVSTDYVFDGGKGAPYAEEDRVAPLGVYGASKEAGEQAVRTANPRHVILRTAWIFSPHGSNFVKTMLRLGKERPSIRVVNDQRGCPTAAVDIAEALSTIALRLIEDHDSPVGTYNFVNDGDATWYEFACEIFEQRRNARYPTPALEPIVTCEYPTLAQRPASSLLATDKWCRDFGGKPRHWRMALHEMLASMQD